VDDLITFDEPADPASCSLPDLRMLRDGYQEVENGLSYARRMVQGRLDIVSVELERRAEQDPDPDLVRRLPGALAAHTRGPGMPRPPQDLEPPAWADEIVAEIDTVLTPGQLAHLADVDDTDLIGAAERIGTLEREISDARRELHARIDRIQDELVGRYRAGASVDDLLS
jgi:hypothetical protein